MDVLDNARMWPCRWDGATLPYVPASPALLFSVAPHDARLRVCVPDHRGAYHQLVRGRSYVEAQLEPVTLSEMAPPVADATRDAATQVGWFDLAPVPRRELRRFLPPDAQAKRRRDGD
jgi:hypothetical protein